MWRLNPLKTAKLFRYYNEKISSRFPVTPGTAQNNLSETATRLQIGTSITNKKINIYLLKFILIYKLYNILGFLWK